MTFISFLSAVLVFFVKNRQPSTIAAGQDQAIDKSWMSVNLHPLIPQKDVRPPDQTFLTFPEWFLVFSPTEQADYFNTHTSTTFPYMKHVDQLWNGYGEVYGQIKDNYPFNTGYHVMIMVIGVSTTVEYGIKSFYETTIGRVTDTAPGAQQTAEDQFNAAYVRRYVNFIEDTPWYEYDFSGELSRLWTSTPVFGSHLVRKMERKYYLTTELLVKCGYGWLIKLGTRSAYDEALLNTAVVIDKLPVDQLAYPEIKNPKQLSGGAVSADLPRYAKFNTAVQHLSASGVNFKEIAGNKGAIMLTALTLRPIVADPAYKLLFTQPITTKPGLKRVAIVTTVNNLSRCVQLLLHNKAVIEHIYDY